MRTRTIARRLWPLALLWAGPVLAAGGHHGVDDAATLEAGQCEQESWFSRAQGGDRLLHAGLNCGVGPVELAVGGEHARAADGSQTAWNLEAKWAREVVQGFSVGLDLQPVWRSHARPRHAATRLLALASWSPREDLSLHLNLGRDFVRRDADLPHHGVGLDWSPRAGWTLTAERYLEERTHFARAGARWEGGRWWTVDFSRAQRLAGPGASSWTLGVTFALGGD